MRKFISLFLCFVLFFALSSTAFAAERIPTANVHIRDPFVLVHDGKYYMYGTIGGIGLGYGCFVSSDLQNWEGPFTVFKAPKNFDGTKHFWAPECHEYEGSFYLFATYYSEKTEHRGVSIFRAESPLGPFTEITDGHITPKDWDCIDGTLYVENGVPYMVFVHEWTSTDDGIGRMDVARLSDDLTRFETQPKELFRADSPTWSDRCVTDGPFVYKSVSGRTMMLWSNMSKDGYCIGTAVSVNGVEGKFRQQFARLYVRNPKHDFDGGHGMLFTDLSGQLMLCMHSPNSAVGDVTEAAAFLPVRDTGYALVLDETPTLLQGLCQWLDRLVGRLFPVTR